MRLFGHEKTLLTLRKHPFSYFKFVLIFFALALVGPAVFFYRDQIVLFDGQRWDLLLLLAGCLYYLYLLLFALYVFFNYLLDAWIITEEHIVNIDQGSLFSRTIAKQEVEKIQDVQTEVRGFFPTLFDYGTIEIQSAGAIERIRFSDVPHPHEVVELILSQVDKLKKQRIAQQAQAIDHALEVGGHVVT